MSDVEDHSCAVLFLCGGNAGRSIIAEAMIDRIGCGKFRGYSAGATPRGAVHPAAIRLLQWRGYRTEEFRPKSWDEFTRADAPRIDLIVTVCDSLIGQTCPVWPGRPIAQHWSIPDPTTAADIDAAFIDTFNLLHEKISALCASLTDAGAA